MEEDDWADRVRSEEVLQRVREVRNILHTVKRRKANWIGHIFCGNCLLKTGYGIRDRGKAKSDGKTRKNT
jgi:hypothetical protein